MTTVPPVAMPENREVNRKITGKPTPTAAKARVADIVAHHPAIHHIVELLQKIPRQQRQGKHQNMAEGTARRHIPDSAFRSPRCTSTHKIILFILYSFSPERARALHFPAENRVK